MIEFCITDQHCDMPVIFDAVDVYRALFSVDPVRKAAAFDTPDLVQKLCAFFRVGDVCPPFTLITVCDEKAIIIRAAMGLCIGHSPNQPFDFGACVMIDDACDRAHGHISADDMEK
jgi:hypothetical protein